MIITADVPRQAGNASLTHIVVKSMLEQLGYVLAGVSVHKCTSTATNVQNIPRKEAT